MQTDHQKIILDHVNSEFLVDDNCESLTIETSLIERGIIDSLGIFRLMAFLQETFDITVEPEEIQPRNFKNIQTIAALVSQKKSLMPATLDNKFHSNEVS